MKYKEMRDYTMMNLAIDQSNLYLLISSKMGWLANMLSNDEGISIVDAIIKLYSSEMYKKLENESALVFVKKMQRHLSTIATQMPPLNPSTNEKNNTPALQWTGNAIDLVEMIYGISEMGCINNGNIKLNELAPVLYAFFGVNSKDCYRFYTDIKRRKNDSRTYFLDKMQVKLNEKMRRDDELERMRR